MVILNDKMFCGEVAKLTGLSRKTVTNHSKMFVEAGLAEKAGRKTTLYYPSAVEWLLENVKPRISPRS